MERKDSWIWMDACSNGCMDGGGKGNFLVTGGFGDLGIEREGRRQGHLGDVLGFWLLGMGVWGVGGGKSAGSLARLPFLPIYFVQ